MYHYRLSVTNLAGYPKLCNGIICIECDEILTEIVAVSSAKIGIVFMEKQFFYYLGLKYV